MNENHIFHDLMNMNGAKWFTAFSFDFFSSSHFS